MTRNKAYQIIAVIMIIGINLLNCDDNPVISRTKATAPLTLQIIHTEYINPGEELLVSLIMRENDMIHLPIDGFTFTIAYDPSFLILENAVVGEMLYRCEWENFSYADTTIDSNLSLIRITASANAPNDTSSNTHCFSSNYTYGLALITFLVKNETQDDTVFTPLRLYWENCDDNKINGLYADEVFISNEIHAYDSVGVYTGDIADSLADFPTYLGANSSCIDTTIHVNNVRAFNVENSGFRIFKPAPVDDKGDLNLNNVRFEEIDAIIYESYFLYGYNAFNIDSSVKI